MSDDHLPNDDLPSDDVLRLVCGELDVAREAEVRASIAEDAELVGLVQRLETAVAGLLAGSVERVSDEFNVRLRLRMLVPGPALAPAAGIGGNARNGFGQNGNDADVAEAVSFVVRPPVSGTSQWPALFGYFSQLGPFSYLVSAALMCVAVLGAWLFKTTDQTPWAENDRAVVSQPAGPTYVGAVTGMDDCRWADDLAEPNEPSPHKRALSVASAVSCGQPIRLKSGLLEITFETGAKVILQGPAKFDVGVNGGFLGVGRLTGKLETKVGGTAIPVPNSRSPVPDPFAIHTPTAVVTDLGTEFGVEVDEYGHTTSQVFRGSVKVHPCALSESEQDAKPEEDVVLKENESVQVRFEAGGKAATVRRIDPDANRFVRHVAGHRIAIPLFNTGIGIAVEQTDPHWQIAAVSNDPSFKPQPAFVLKACRWWVPNEPEKSQWISIAPRWQQMQPHEVVYTFRTTFELKDVLPETAAISGWFVVDNLVRAIRLNGQNVAVPKHGCGEYTLHHRFVIKQGFVEGTNVLEFDVENCDTDVTHVRSPMGFRADLTGTVRKK